MTEKEMFQPEFGKIDFMSQSLIIAATPLYMSAMGGFIQSVEGTTLHKFIWQIYRATLRQSPTELNPAQSNHFPYNTQNVCGYPVRHQA